MALAARFLFFFICVTLSAGSVQAEEAKRFALLIGNQTYSKAVGPLKNPRADVDLIAQSLRKLQFVVTVLKDANYRQMDVAIKRHLAVVRRGRAGAISFLYYSGHGIAQPETRINYILPIDIARADSDIWFNSFEQQSIIDRMKRHAPNATHYVVFDACRNELNVARSGAKSLRTNKGFEPVRNTAGVLIAYATAPGKTASDDGVGGGTYAKILAAELLRPGIESVGVFRNVQLKVAHAINQEPWLTYGTLPEIFFAGKERPEVADWLRIKESDQQKELEEYLKKYPNSHFSDSARLRIRILTERQRNRAAARDWERLETSTNIAELERYIRTYPKHAYSRLARFRIDQLREDEARREQLAAWEAVKDSESISLLEQFVMRYPHSFLATVAQDKIARLKESTSQSGKSVESEAAEVWSQIRDTDDPEVFEKFIQKFRSSPLVALAAEKLAALRRKRPNTPPVVARPTPASIPKAEPERKEEPSKRKVTNDGAKVEINIAELTKSLQRELQRVGCDPGPIDGKWGALGRQAVERFNLHAKMNIDKVAPTLAAVEVIRKKKDRVCPEKKTASVGQESAGTSKSREDACQEKKRVFDRICRRGRCSSVSREVYLRCLRTGTFITPGGSIVHDDGRFVQPARRTCEQKRARFLKRLCEGSTWGCRGSADIGYERCKRTGVFRTRRGNVIR